jgi:hypothetical protein
MQFYALYQDQRLRFADDDREPLMTDQLLLILASFP